MFWSHEVAEKRFDAVMTDVSLPGMSGIELTKALGLRYPLLPVVISSGYGVQNVAALLGPGYGRVLVLTKPYNMEMLETTLGQAAAFPHE